jgi:hypothetical protein
MVDAMQLSLIDPRQHPVATEEMLCDAGLKSAIRTMRKRAGTATDAAWPYVEGLLDIAGRPAWAVVDAGVRYVVVGNVVFGIDDLMFAEDRLRMAALAAFARLDAAEVTA